LRSLFTKKRDGNAMMPQALELMVSVFKSGSKGQVWWLKPVVPAIKKITSKCMRPYLKNKLKAKSTWGHSSSG
jgi:hypothetical protein